MQFNIRGRPQSHTGAKSAFTGIDYRLIRFCIESFRKHVKRKNRSDRKPKEPKERDDLRYVSTVVLPEFRSQCSKPMRQKERRTYNSHQHAAQKGVDESLICPRD